MIFKLLKILKNLNTILMSGKLCKQNNYIFGLGIHRFNYSMAQSILNRHLYFNHNPIRIKMIFSNISNNTLYFYKPNLLKIIRLVKHFS
jgi:hypothetical protein